MPPPIPCETATTSPIGRPRFRQLSDGTHTGNALRGARLTYIRFPVNDHIRWSAAAAARRAAGAGDEEKRRRFLRDRFTGATASSIAATLKHLSHRTQRRLGARDASTDVYVRDRQTNTITLVSRATGATGASGDGRPAIPRSPRDGTSV